MLSDTVLNKLTVCEVRPIKLKKMRAGARVFPFSPFIKDSENEVEGP